MNLLNKILFGLIVLTAVAITGCAINQEKDFLSRNNIAVERVNSKYSHIGMVYVTESEKGILIRGEIRKHPHTRGAIPGYLVVEIIGEKDNSKFISNVKYHRRSHKAKVARFKVELDFALEKNDVIRITHHRG